jgi:protein PhnA
MKLEAIVLQRSGNKCELCGADQGISFYEVPFSTGRYEGNCRNDL